MGEVVNTSLMPVDVGGVFLAPGEVRVLTDEQEKTARRGGHGRPVGKKAPPKGNRGGGKGGKE